MSFNHSIIEKERKLFIDYIEFTQYPEDFHIRIVMLDKDTRFGSTLDDRRFFYYMIFNECIRAKIPKKHAEEIAENHKNNKRVIIFVRDSGEYTAESL